MTFSRGVVTWLLIIPVFFAMDLLWLGVVAKDFYRRHLGYLMAPQINWAAAILFYLLFLGGLVFFAVKPGFEAGSPVRALACGALFGFLAYATYDLTNLATIRSWPPVVAVVDMLWGTVLSGTVAWSGAIIALRTGR
jgi:uncharacterized membrane protein